MNKTNKKSTILVIDDTPDILSLVMGLLKDDYNLKLASGPHKALNLLQSEPEIDLILLDIMMPEIDGYEMCKIIMSSAIQKCTKTQCKNAPLRNTYYLTEISNNPASLFCFNL